MKLPAFVYQAARSVAEAVELLGANPGESRILAGGQSLLPMMALRLATPAAVIDIGRCADLRTYALTDDRLVVSAAVTGREVERATEVGSRHPLLVAALGHVGHPEIRNRGTVCGSVAHADPAAEMPAVLLATGGAVRVAGPRGRRRILAADFFVGPYLNALDPGEMVAGVEFPLLPSGTGWALREVARRSGDFALAGAVCLVQVGDHANACVDASITVFGLAGVPSRRPEAEALLRTDGLGETTLEDAARLAVDGLDIHSDVHGSASFRAQVGAVAVRRALREATAMARQHAGERAEHGE